MENNAVTLCQKVLKEKLIRLIKVDIQAIFSEKNTYATDKTGNVTGLNLSSQSLKDGSFLSGFKTLEYLVLSYNKMTDISFIGHLKNLARLDMAHNHIREIPDLRDLEKLSWLNLGNNKISTLPDDIPDWGLEIKCENEHSTGLILAGNPLEEPLKQAIQNGRKALTEYFRQHQNRDLQKEKSREGCNNTQSPGKNQVVHVNGNQNKIIIAGGNLKCNLPEKGKTYPIGKEEIKMKIKKILILAANPKDTPKLRLDKEIRDSMESILRAKFRDRFEIHSQGAVGTRDLRKAILELEPNIVHFIGHGEKEGLILEDEMGFSKLVTAEALSGLFKLFSDKIECIILSACYSAKQALAINKHIDYVIGMQKDITDEAAIEFSVGFYDTLGAGKSIERAFEIGCSAIQLHCPDQLEHLVPVLKRKK